LGRLQEALEGFKSALNLRRNAPAVLKNRGNVLVRFGRFTEAMPILKPRCRSSRTSPRLTMISGIRYPKPRNWTRRPRVFARPSRSPPATPPPLNNLRKVLVLLKRPEEALRQIDETISISPGMPDLLNIKEVGLKDLDRFDEALACFDRAIAINARFAAAHTNRGICREAMARYGEALADYERALSIDPNEPETQWNLAVNRLRLGDLRRGWIESK
jgi:tetratricopeptide (TPR) repeat protein